ncbi:MAG: hypothetical protein HY671_10095 [Chloroflexi bacterium]|nr:hypothetical protein [Chloroflexota bacterium]
MTALWVGAIGFLIAFSLDLVSLKRVPVLKPIIIATVVAMQLYALYGVSVGVERFSLPAWLPPLGWALAPVGFCLLVYSIFIEIPFLASYARRGAGSQLVTTGTYALTRHPGALWFAVFLAGLLLGTRSQPLLIAAPVWLALEIVWVVLEDRLFLPRAFSDYPAYRRQTPMLIPNAASFKRFLNTWKRKEP